MLSEAKHLSEGQSLAFRKTLRYRSEPALSLPKGHALFGFELGLFLRALPGDILS